MTKYLKSSLTLFCICAFFALLLSLVNMVTEPRIKALAEQRVLDSLSMVIPSNSRINMDKGEVTVNKDGVNSYYIVENADKSLKGYVLNLKGSGYGGEFTVLAYYSKDGKLEKSKLLDNSETSGIGKKYENDEAISLFASYDRIPTSKKDLDPSDSLIVSGASVTFQGLSSALIGGQNYINSVLKGGLK